LAAERVYSPSDDTGFSLSTLFIVTSPFGSKTKHMTKAINLFRNIHACLPAYHDIIETKFI
jgi:hypothetical protein